MKFFAVFAAILSVAFGYQTTWSLSELSQAIQNPYTSAHIVPYLEKTLNQMMAALHHGEHIEALPVTIPAMDLTAWTIPALTSALESPTTDPAMVPYVSQALSQVVTAVLTGQSQVATEVVIPAMDVTLWNLNEISNALENPSTNPVMVPYLETALNSLMDALFAGHQMTAIAVAIPADVPLEIIFEPIDVSPVEVPVVPAEVPSIPSAPSTASSPLVQIIINVNADGAVAPADVAEIKPEPVIVVDQPEIAPTPVIIPEPVIIAEPIIVPEPVIIPGPVNVVDAPAPVAPVVVVSPVVAQPVNVVDAPVPVAPVVVTNPQIAVNPVDVIAIQPAH